MILFHLQLNLEEFILSPSASKDIKYLPEITLYTDASEEGSVLKEHFRQFYLVFNLLLLFIAHMAVLSDNTTALEYFRNMYGVKSKCCNEVAKNIWQWCEDRNFWLAPSFIPGVFCM